MSYQVDSYGNAYFPAGVSVASIPATTGTQARVLVPGANGRISSATIAQLVTQSGGNIVSSIFGRTGAVVAKEGDYTTDQITETGGALYFSTSRARKSIFLTTFNTSGPATYDTNTGILNIPQYGSGSSSVGNYVPLTRTITINGQVADLSVDRIFTVASMVYPSAGIALSNGVSWEPSITNNSVNWNTAFSWGNHAGLYSLLGHTHTFASLTSKPTTLAGYGITDAATSAQGTKADTAFGWGNHALAGYLTSFTETDPIWTSEKANYALKTYVDTSISNLVDAAPTTLNTLNELAAALGDDANFSTSITTLIGTKEPAITAGTTAQYWRGDKSWQTLPIYTLSGLGGEPVITAGTTAQYWRGDKTWQTLPTYNLSLYVPYTGATANVDLGSRTFTTSSIFITGGSGTGGNLTFGQSDAFSIPNANNSSIDAVTTAFSFAVTAADSTYKYFKFETTALTNNTLRSYILPDASGTIALTSNIPTLSGLGGVPTTRSLTINGVSYDLSADRSWTISAGISGSGTTNYLSKWTGSASIGNSVAFDNGSAIGINTASPFESSAFKLDVNGGVIIKNTSGVPAQLILIDSNPATGGNNGFVQLSAGGNTGTAFGQWQTYYGTSIASGTLRLQPAGGVVLVGSTTAITGAGLFQVAGDVNITGTFRVNGVAIGSGTTLNGTGFVKASGTTISYDNSTYLTTASASSTYQTILTNPVTGTGTAGYIPKFTSGSAIGNSTIEEAEGSVFVYNNLVANTGEFQGDSSFRTTSNSIGSEIKVLLGVTTGRTIYSIIKSTIVDNLNSQFKGRLSFDVRNGNNSYITPLILEYTGAATFASTVTATSFFRSGGTSSQFLKADGSIDSSTYLPLGGGTLSGGLNGTTASFTGNLTVSSGNATGGGIILADDGDIVDLNDAYCSMRFSAGVRIFSANRGGTPVITLSNTGAISGSSVAAGNITTGVNGSHIVQRDANGYIYANHVNFNTSETENPAINSFITSNGDGWSRKSTLAHVKNSIRGIADGSWAISAAQLGGLSLQQVVRYHSGSDFANGTLVITNINGAATYGDSFVMEVTGKSYGSGPAPFGLLLEGYIYADTFINVGAISYGSWFPGPIRILNYNGNLAFWWPRGSYWNSFSVYVREAGGGSSNRVTSIIDSTEPSVSKKVSVGIIQSLNSSNYNSYSPTLTGGGASGTWGINITGSAATATDSTKLPLAGGTLTGNLLFANSGTTKRGIQGVCGDNDFWFIGGGATASNSGFLEIATGDDGQSSSAEPIYVRQYGPGDVLTGTLVRTAALLDANGNTSFPGTVTAPTFSGNLSGNATNITAHTINQSVGTGNTPTFAGAIIGCGVSTGRGGYAPGTLNLILTSSSAGSDGVSGIDFRSGNNYPSDGASIYYENSQTGSGEVSRLVFRVENDLNDSILMRAGYHVYNARTVDNASQGADNPVFRWQYLDSNRMTLDSSGNLVCNGDITAYSDARVKTDVKPIENSIEKIQAIRGVTFLRTDAQEQDKEKRHAGVIAQEVLEVLPEVVTENNEGMYSVAYGNLVALLIEGMKEQQIQIEELKKEIKELKNK